jgi:hypothetical protein
LLRLEGRLGSVMAEALVLGFKLGGVRCELGGDAGNVRGPARRVRRGEDPIRLYSPVLCPCRELKEMLGWSWCARSKRRVRRQGPHLRHLFVSVLRPLSRLRQASCARQELARSLRPLTRTRHARPRHRL